MIRVNNRKAVRRLAWRSFRANRLRNVFAILAMILTTILFTSLFTTATLLNYSFQQQTMRMVGGYSHGGFKYLTEEQTKQLSKHPLIKEYGRNLFLSDLFEGNFAKHSAEIRYFDKNSARMFFSYPSTGTMPVDEYDLATDTAVLKQLGLEPKLGEKVTITYPLGNKKVTGTFTLCGYWKTDDLMPTSQILLSKEYVEDQLKGYQPLTNWDIAGKWDLEIMFHNSLHIEDNLRKVAQDNGFQIDDKTKDNYLDCGVNWGYTLAQMDHNNTMVLAVAAIAVVILFAGYLIIYNIFFISVANDIRFYGLLKTIGTTGRQIRRIIRYQALLLTGIGIPFGMIFGYLIGTRITGVIMKAMSSTTVYQKADLRIFIGAALFTVLTVLISIRKPGKVAARVSPIEAVRYTEQVVNEKKKVKKTRHGARIHRMAVSNLLRNKKKTAIVLISLILSIVLLNSVYVFTIGFDLNKMLSQSLASDFVLSGSNYFNVRSSFRLESDSPSENYLEAVQKQQGIEGYGTVYYDLKIALIDYTQEMFDVYSKIYPDPNYANRFYHIHGENSMDSDIQLYGMDDYALKKLVAVEGSIDIDKLKSGKYIIEVVETDDYDKPIMETDIYHPGDQVSLDYIDNMDYSDASKIKHHQQTYEVMAVVKLNTGMSVRYYKVAPVFILPSESFMKDTGTATVMSYLVDAQDSKESAIEKFLKNYTTKSEISMSYDSKEQKRKEFDQWIRLFRVVGNALGLVVGVIGLLNFINVVLTGIITRKKELSILRGIGMTKKQQTTMLYLEGLIYSGFTVLISAALSALINVTLVRSLGSGLWFFSASFSLLPVILVTPFLLIFSVVVPYVSYQAANKDSIIDQLRAQE